MLIAEEIWVKDNCKLVDCIHSERFLWEVLRQKLLRRFDQILCRASLM